jgi:hypothetical protein
VAGLCSVCKHPKLQAINHALIAGRSCREIAAQYRTSPDAMERHKASHLPRVLKDTQETDEVSHANDLLYQVRILQARALRILIRAEAAGDLRTALAGVREATRCIELLARLTGDLDERPVVNLLVSAEWLEIRAVLLEALTPYPEARVSVAMAAASSPCPAARKEAFAASAASTCSSSMRRPGWPTGCT